MSVSMLDMHHSNWQPNHEKEISMLKQHFSTTFDQALRSTQVMADILYFCVLLKTYLNITFTSLYLFGCSVVYVLRDDVYRPFADNLPVFHSLMLAGLHMLARFLLFLQFTGKASVIRNSQSKHFYFTSCPAKYPPSY